MHPVFSSKNGLLLYLAGWIPLGAMLTLVVTVSGRFRWTEAASVTVPATFLLACVCLPPWYACRSLPLRSTPKEKLIINHVVAAMCATAIVMVFAHALVAVLSRFFPKLHHGFA